MRLAFLALTLTLAACDRPADPDPAPEAPAEMLIPAEPDGSIADTAGPPADPAIAAGEIPARFHGVWDSGDCSAASNTRVEITPRRIEYYESVGAVTQKTPASGGDALIAVAMEGEGMTWTDRIRLQITTSQGRDALLLLPQPDTDNAVRPVPRFPCPA